MTMQINQRSKVDARVAAAFRTAAAATGTSFDRLARTAARESDMRTDAAASTSSAKGLFQFVDQTWFELIKKEGPNVGLERLADRISVDEKGAYAVADAKEKAKILALKTDPLVASVMAGRFTETNARALAESLGRKATDGEVYAAHVLGSTGAAKLIRIAESEPASTAAIAFPKAAAANPDLFYGKDGKPRSASELLSRLTGTSTDTASRIAEAHAAIPAEKTSTLDASTLGELLRAQAKVHVTRQGIAGDGLDAVTAGRFARAALAEKSLPGASADTAPPIGARVDGWRAKTSKDAFSALLRSDGETLAADAARAADPAAAVTDPSIRFASHDAATMSRVGGVAGGIAFVDPNQPMRLVADASGAVGVSGQPVGARPSRLLMSRAAAGAPDMPLPVVEGGVVVRPVRASASMLTTRAAASDVEAEASGLVAPGAARVRTVSITLPTGGATGGSDRTLLPPVPGEVSDPSAPPIPVAVVPRRAATHDGRPLDLLATPRRAGRAIASRPG